MGRDHAVKRRNSQDAVCFGHAGSAAYGVVSDGCGEGRKSELGAALSVAVVGGALRAELERGASPEATWRPAVDALHGALREVVARVAREPEGARLFIREHLLATVLAFVVTADSAIVFTFGDGLVLVDDETRVLHEDNRPSYPAYALLGRPSAPGLFRFGSVSTIGVATDGLDADDLRAVSTAKHPDLSRALRMRQIQGRLEDDGAIVVATRSREILEQSVLGGVRDEET